MDETLYDTLIVELDNARLFFHSGSLHGMYRNDPNLYMKVSETLNIISSYWIATKVQFTWKRSVTLIPEQSSKQASHSLYAVEEILPLFLKYCQTKSLGILIMLEGQTSLEHKNVNDSLYEQLLNPTTCDQQVYWSSSLS